MCPLEIIAWCLVSTRWMWPLLVQLHTTPVLSQLSSFMVDWFLVLLLYPSITWGPLIHNSPFVSAATAFWSSPSDTIYENMQHISLSFDMLRPHFLHSSVARSIPRWMLSLFWINKYLNNVWLKSLTPNTSGLEK